MDGTRNPRPTKTLSIAAVVTVASVLLTASAAWGAVTWDPASDSRTLNRPRTCNTPTSACTDSWFTFNVNGPAFAVSNDGGTHYQHAIWFTDHFGDQSGSYADYTTNCGPNCAGLYYARSSDGGATWDGGTPGTDATRIGTPNQTTQRGAIATAGPYVYVAYVTTQGYWNRMCANSERLLHVAVNSNYGSGSWTTVQLTTSGRVDFPSIAASGSNVFVVHTNSATGQVVVNKSTDNGATFSPQGIGWSENTFDNQTSPGNPKCLSPPTPSGLEGYDSAPVIATDGSSVAAAWIGNTSGQVRAKISTDNGATWPGDENGVNCATTPVFCTMHLTGSGAIGPSSNDPATARGTVSIAGMSGRFAFAWKNNVGSGIPKGIYVRQFTTAGGFGPSRLISCLQTTAPCSAAPAGPVYNDASATSVALYGTAGIGVTWAGCPYSPTTPAAPCNNKIGGINADPGAEILFKESWNSGVTWWAGQAGSFQTVAANSATGSPVNEFPTLVYDKPGASSTGCAMGTQGPEVGCVRYVYFTGRSKNFFDYAMYLSTGTQS